MELIDVIRVSPVALAAAFGRTDIGRGRSAMRRARARRRQFEYRDVLGEIRMGRLRLNARGVIVAGQWWHPPRE